MKTSFSVLQLEIEDLKDNINCVQSEIAMCMANLSIQHEKVCDVVDRLESISVLLKDVIEFNSVEDNHASLSASSKNIERKAIHSIALDICAIRTSEELFTHSNIKVNDIKELNKKCDSAVDKDDDRNIITTADLNLSTTRPSLTKKIKVKVHDQIRDKAKADSAQTVNDSSITKFSTSTPVLCSRKTSFPGSLASCQATTSVKMTVNKVKEMCRNHDWKLEGCHSTRAGKEKSAAVHFYKVSVKMLDEYKVVRGVGSNKVEAVQRAFKSMELLLRDANNEDGTKVGFRKISHDGLSDNVVNFDENPLLSFKPCDSSQDLLSQPPVFHAQGCEKYPTASHSSSEKLDYWVPDNYKIEKRITLSDNDVAALIGAGGRRINKLEKSTGAKISVFGLPGDVERQVKLRGTQNQVIKALKMIQTMGVS